MKRLYINLFVGFSKLLGVLPMLLFFKPKVYRTGKKAKLRKGHILVSNHKSLMDFVLYQLIFFFKTVYFLMAEVLYKKGALFRFMLNSLGGIKVERETKEFGFVSQSLEALEKKRIVGIFPEGRLPIGGKPWPFTTSTAFIAMHSGAPVLPVYTDGNYGLFKRTHVCVGEPFLLTDYAKEGLSEEEQLKHLTKVLEEKVYALKAYMEEKQGKGAQK